MMLLLLSILLGICQSPTFYLIAMFGQYIYDGDGGRIGQTVTGSVYVEYSYFNDTSTGISRVLAELDSGENYIYGGRLLHKSGLNGSIFYHQDGLGGISAISDVYGAPLNIYEHKEIGICQIYRILRSLSFLQEMNLI